MSPSIINPPTGVRKTIRERVRDPQKVLMRLVTDVIVHVDHIAIHCPHFPEELDGLHRGIHKLGNHDKIRLTCPKPGQLITRDNVEWLAELQEQYCHSPDPRERLTHSYLELTIEMATGVEFDSHQIRRILDDPNVKLRYPPSNVYEYDARRRLVGLQKINGKVEWTNGVYWAPDEADKNLVAYSSKPKHFESSCRLEVRLAGEVLRKLVPTLRDLLVVNPRMIFKQTVHFGNLGVLPLVSTEASWG